MCVIFFSCSFIFLLHSENKRLGCSQTMNPFLCLFICNSAPYPCGANGVIRIHTALLTFSSHGHTTCSGTDCTPLNSGLLFCQLGEGKIQHESTAVATPVDLVLGVTLVIVFCYFDCVSKWGTSGSQVGYEPWSWWSSGFDMVCSHFAQCLRFSSVFNNK